MSKKKDLISLGEAYGDVLNNVVVSEEVEPGKIGEAPLEGGGPEEKGGFRPPLVDITKLSDKDKEDNIYNIGGLTYGDGNDPGLNNNSPEPTGPTYGQVAYSGKVGAPEEDEEDEEKPDYIDADGDGDKKESMKKALKDKKKGDKDEEAEEDEEFLAEHEKIARAGLNNFMSKTSVFDKLYNKVMVTEEVDEVEDVTELDALGIEDPGEGGDVPEEITVSIPGELAETLCDILRTALAQQETEVDIDVDVTDVTDTEVEDEEDPEEDEEAAMKDGGGYGVDAGSTLKKEVNYGKKNKVGKLRPAGGAVQKDGGGYGVDAGSTLHHTVDHALKNNKVGNTKLGSIPGA